MNREDMKCDACVFFEEWTDKDKKDRPTDCLGDGFCRRFPPTLVVIGRIGRDLLGRFPRVVKKSWCGEWRPK